MEILLKILKRLGLVILIFVIHIAITNILPYPFNHINIFYLGIFYLVFLSEKPKNIWYLLPLIFLLELFVATPFGVNFLTYFILTLFMSWLFANIFTARSFPFITLYFIIGLTVYRVLFNILNYIIGRATTHTEFNPTTITLNIFAEVGLTTAVMVVFHIFYSFFNKKFNPKYLGSS